eukprot:scaffold34_cov271-Prasinococcus_capsulatus_cf.AAC.9
MRAFFSISHVHGPLKLAGSPRGLYLREALLEERVGRAVEAVLVKIVARADDELGAERIHDAAH